jgi:hypothetical protein
VNRRRTTLVAVGLVLAFLAPMSTAYALWMRTASATVDVSVQAGSPTLAAPTIQCGAFTANGAYTMTWTTVSGLTYTVYRSTTTNADASYTSQTASATTPYTASMPNGTTYWRVRATDGTTTSGWSNTLQLTRTGNGGPSHACTGTTP